MTKSRYEKLNKVLAGAGQHAVGPAPGVVAGNAITVPAPVAEQPQTPVVVTEKPTIRKGEKAVVEETTRKRPGPKGEGSFRSVGVTRSHCLPPGFWLTLEDIQLAQRDSETGQKPMLAELLAEALNDYFVKNGKASVPVK